VRIQILSDLHFEFQADAGHEFVQSLDPTDVDVLAIAGDLGVGESIGPALDQLCKRFARSAVVYVHGNHEFYSTARESVLGATRQAVERNSNLVWLDVEATEIAGRRFLGAPLWFREAPEAARFRKAMTDYMVIPDFESWVYVENARALAFFEHELRPGDIVLTHHLPAEGSVAARFKGHPLNPFFLCDIEPLIKERAPALWIHGHTHCSADYRLGETRVVCNPFGYASFELNREFSESFVVEL